MQHATAIKFKSCKKMGDATSVMPVIRSAFSVMGWADTIDMDGTL